MLGQLYGGLTSGVHPVGGSDHEDAYVWWVHDTPSSEQELYINPELPFCS